MCFSWIISSDISPSLWFYFVNDSWRFLWSSSLSFKLSQANLLLFWYTLNRDIQSSNLAVSLWMDLWVCKICCSICWASKLDEFWFTRVCTILFSSCVNSSVEHYNTDLDTSTFFWAFSKMWTDFRCSFCWSGIWILACLNFLSKLTFSFIHPSNWSFNSPNTDSFEEMTGFTFSNSATSDQCKVFWKAKVWHNFPFDVPLRRRSKSTRPLDLRNLQWIKRRTSRF